MSKNFSYYGNGPSITRGRRVQAGQECLKAICDGESKAMHRGQLDDLGNRQVMYTAKNPKWQEIQKQILELGLLYLENMQEELKLRRPLNLNDFSKEQIKSVQVITTLDNFFKWANKHSYEAWTLEESLLKTKMEKLNPPKYIPDFSDLVIKVRNSSAFWNAEREAGLPMEVMWKRMYPNKSQIAFRKILIEKIETLANKLERVSYLNSRIIMTSSLEGYKQKNSPFSISEVYDEYINLTYLNQYLSGEISEMFKQHPADLERLISDYNNSQSRLLDKFISNMDINNADIRSISGFQAAVEKCEKDILTNLENAPSKLRLRVLRDSFQDLKEKTKKLMTFKDSTKAKDFNERIDALDYKIPRDHVENERFIQDRLNNEILKQKIGLEKKRDKKLVEENILITVMDYDSKQKNIDEIFEDFSDICKEFKTRPLSDHIYTGEGQIYISWLVFNHWDMGIGVLAHEIGHTVYNFFLRNIYEMSHSENAGVDDYSCVTDFKKPFYLGKPQLRYTDEDFSDRFAGRLIKLLKDEGLPAYNYGCVFQYKENGSWVPEMNHDSEDTHSSDFFRTLHIQSMLGPLPQECQVFKKELACN